jgi:hypothetical protein
MSQSTLNSEILPSTASKRKTSNPQAWYRPTFSPEHGVYVVLLVSFLTGVAAAQNWTLATTLAFISAFCSFQAEHPLILQIKQHKSLKPRFLIWAGLYSTVALAIAVRIAVFYPILLWIYAGAILAFCIDAISVFHRQQKSIVNEFITFTAVCLCAPFAYAATTGTISKTAIGLWILNTLFFSSAIFTVKLRKSKTHSPIPGLVYHAIATLMIVVLWYVGWLSPVTACAFIVAVLKFGLVVLGREWYCTTQIKYVAMLETISALLFGTIASVSVLPPHL